MRFSSKYLASIRAVLLITLAAFFAVSCTVLGGGGSSTAKASGKELSEKELMEFTTLFFDGNKAKILGDYAMAKKHFTQALRINPESGATKFELSKLYAEKGMFNEAVQMAQGARDSDLSNVWYAHFLAQLYAETGSLDKSIAILQQIIKDQPEEYENYFNLASLLSAQGKFKEALEIYDKLEGMLGPNEDISVQRQLIYLEKGDLERALKEATALIDANPEELRYYGMKAEILQQMKRTNEARELYEVMLFENPNNGLVLLALYEMSAQAGDREKADEYLNRAFDSQDLNIDLKVNILLNYLSGTSLKHRPEFIMGLGDKLENAHPNEAKAYAIQGDIYYNLNKFEEARSKFRKAIAIDANRPPIWQQVLTIDSQLNDFESMKKESDEALELFPMLPIFYLFNGISNLQLKNAEAAEEALEAGLALVIDNPPLKAQFYASLGDAYHELGKHEKSDNSYDKSLEIEGSNAVVLNNYAYYLSQREMKLDKAEAMAKKANNLSPDVASFQDTYAWVLFKRGNYRNALFWVEEALKHGGENDAVVLDHYGDILRALDRKEDALKAWQRALDVGGDQDSIITKINSEQIGE